MERMTLTPEQFKNRPVRVLGNMGTEDESTTVEVECENMGDVNVRTVKNWIQEGGCKTLAEAPFRNGPEGRRVWEQAFSNFKRDDKEFHENRFTIVYDDGTPGPRTSVSASIAKATVELEDGAEHDDVFYITLSRSAGTPDEVLIMQRD